MDKHFSSIIFFVLAVLVLFVFGCANQQTSSNSITDNSAKPSVVGGQLSTVLSNQADSEAASVIIIKDSSFTPNSLTIAKGEVVRWVNQDSITHAIKSDTFNSEQIGKGQMFEFRFENLGTYDYICGIHTSMKGRIIVN